MKILIIIFISVLILTTAHSQEQKVPVVPLVVKFHTPEMRPEEIVLTVRGRLLKTDAKPIRVECAIVFDNIPPTKPKEGSGTNYVAIVQQTADWINGTKTELQNWAQSAISGKFGADVPLGSCQETKVEAGAEQKVLELEAKGFKFKKGIRGPKVGDKQVTGRLFAKEIYSEQDDYGEAEWTITVTCKPEINNGVISLHATGTLPDSDPTTSGVPANANAAVLKIRIGAFKNEVAQARNDLQNLVNYRPWKVPPSVHYLLLKGEKEVVKPIPLPVGSNLELELWKGKQIPPTLTSTLRWSGTLELPMVMTGDLVKQIDKIPDEEDWKEE